MFFDKNIAVFLMYGLNIQNCATCKMGLLEQSFNGLIGVIPDEKSGFFRNTLAKVIPKK